MFTDIIPDDDNTLAADTLTTTDDAISGKTYSSDMTEAGLAIALSTGKKLTPYIDVSYATEDTTSAAYATENTTDEGNDLAASAADGYMTYGGGVILSLSDKVNGHLSITETTGREDFSETTISGSFRLKF